MKMSIRNSNARGYSIAELLTVLALGLIIIMILISTIISSFGSFRYTKLRVFDILKQRHALSHINSYVNRSSYGIVSDNIDANGFGNKLEMYGYDNNLLWTYTNEAVSMGS